VGAFLRRGRGFLGGEYHNGGLGGIEVGLVEALLMRENLELSSGVLDLGLDEVLEGGGLVLGEDFFIHNNRRYPCQFLLIRITSLLLIVM